MRRPPLASALPPLSPTLRAGCLPVQKAVAEYSADAMRWALADAGDALDDANFETSTANAAILRLTKELGWIEEALAPDAGEGGAAARACGLQGGHAIAAAASRHGQSPRRLL